MFWDYQIIHLCLRKIQYRGTSVQYYYVSESQQEFSVLAMWSDYFV